MREVNLLNNGNANLLVPKSEVLSAEATLRSLISLASTFSLIRSSARFRWRIPLVMCGISPEYTHAWLSSSMIVALCDNPTSNLLVIFPEETLFRQGWDILYWRFISLVGGYEQRLKANELSPLLESWTVSRSVKFRRIWLYLAKSASNLLSSSKMESSVLTSQVL